MPGDAPFRWIKAFAEWLRSKDKPRGFLPAMVLCYLIVGAGIAVFYVLKWLFTFFG